MIRFLFPLAVLVVAAACQQDRADIGGAPLGEASDHPMVARETLRLGATESSGPESFDRVTSLAIDANGNLFVGNSGDGTVRVFDRSGRFRRQFGGKGEGPGEVSSISTVIVVGDTVIVTDRGRGSKVVLFRTDGTLLRSWRTRDQSNTIVIPIRPLQEGWLAWYHPPFGRPAVSAGDSLIPVVETRIVDLDSRAVGPPIHRVPLSIQYGTPAGRPEWGLFRQAWSRGLDGKGRLFLVHPGDYKIDIYDANGQLTRRLRRAFDPRPITSDDVEALRLRVAEIVDTISRGPRAIPPQARAQQRERILSMIDARAALPMPEVASPLGRILVSEDGAFWVAHQAPSSVVDIAARRLFGSMDGPPERPTEWAIFDQDASFVGVVELPARFRPLAIQGREVVGVFRNDYDVEFVVRFLARSSGL